VDLQRDARLGLANRLWWNERDGRDGGIPSRDSVEGYWRHFGHAQPNRNVNTRMPMSFKAQPEMNRDVLLAAGCKARHAPVRGRSRASSSLAVEDRMRNPGSFMCTTHIAKISRRRFRDNPNVTSPA
jgi:hypothetical protein